MTLDGLLRQIDTFIAEGGPRTISYLNMHVLHQSLRCHQLAEFLNEVDLCYCDGKGIVWAAGLLGYQLPGRMTGADWIWDLAARAENRWRIFWLGGEPGVTALAAARLKERHPALDLLTDHGFHPKKGPANTALLERINSSNSDILLVGMGTPLQERWVRENRNNLGVPVVWCLGATADFVSGKVSRGPAFLHQRHEWLARLLVDPRRLWKRYLLGNSEVMARMLFERMKKSRSMCHRQE